MIRLIKNNNYIESYKQLKFVDKIKLSTSFFKQSETRKLFIKNNGKYITDLEKNKPCLYCNTSVNRGYETFNNFYCVNCLKPASLENATQIFINTISESENN